MIDSRAFFVLAPIVLVLKWKMILSNNVIITHDFSIVTVRSL